MRLLERMVSVGFAEGRRGGCVGEQRDEAGSKQGKRSQHTKARGGKTKMVIGPDLDVGSDKAAQGAQGVDQGDATGGGDLVELTLRIVKDTIPFKAVSATKGKRIGAEPISALYEQNRVRHVGGLAQLEDQMCNWVPGSGQPSPDRLDALVWAITELKLTRQDTGILDFMAAEAAKASS